MSPKQTRVTIERVRRITTHIQRIELGVDDNIARIRPGQSLLVRANDTSWDPYLSERWVPVALDGRTITVECPVDGKYTPGQIVSVLGPVGAPFPMRFNLRNLLLIAMDVPPTQLILLATLALRSQIEVTLVLTGAATTYPLDALPEEVEVLTGDLQNGWPNQVFTVGWADQVIAVTAPHYHHIYYPALVERIHELRAEVPQRYMLGLFDIPMVCGTGACHGCGITLKDGTAHYTCQDGPALDLEQVSFDLAPQNE